MYTFATVLVLSALGATAFYLTGDEEESEDNDKIGRPEDPDMPEGGPPVTG